MNPGEKYLDELVRKLKPLLAEDPNNSRESLEATLLPLVRCALRTGLGQPCLVGWVRCQTAAGRRSPDPCTSRAPEGSRAAHEQDLVGSAGPITRELTDKLWARRQPLPSRETVVNW
jgi:hypothetical protein